MLSIICNKVGFCPDPGPIGKILFFGHLNNSNQSVYLRFFSSMTFNPLNAVLLLKITFGIIRGCHGSYESKGLTHSAIDVVVFNSINN